MKELGGIRIPSIWWAIDSAIKYGIFNEKNIHGFFKRRKKKIGC